MAIIYCKKMEVRIAFVDFWPGCDQQNHIITKALKQKYEVKFVHPQEADYVFFSVFGDEHWSLPDETVKIFYTGENLCPDFNICDYAIGFEWMDFGDRYYRLPNYYATEFFLPKVEQMLQKHHLSADKDYVGRKFCSFVVSNPAGSPIRREAFERISTYKKVDSGGRWLNNIGGPVEDKLAFDSEHKFSIVCENSSHRGYTTEKIVEAFAAQTIPIYWGDPEVTRVYNPKAFINIQEYANWDDLIAEVKKIDENKDLYIRMLKEPAIKDGSFTYQEQFDGMAAFLAHIIEQPHSEAYRYNREFWGKRYVERERALMQRSERKTWKDYLKASLKRI